MSQIPSVLRDLRQKSVIRRYVQFDDLLEVRREMREGVMNKKRLFVRICVIAILSVLLNGCTAMAIQKEDIKDKSNDLQNNLIKERIEYFTKNTFRSSEKIEMEMVDNDLRLFVSFVPEVGSFPIKEDIYKSIAAHAIQVRDFFPEVSEFEYSILWNDLNKEEVINVKINKEATNKLRGNYYGEEINKNGGFNPDYSKLFSSVKETDESKTWR